MAAETQSAPGLLLAVAASGVSAAQTSYGLLLKNYRLCS